jgi:RNA polymerase sigma factor for flagellar operon FliA
MEREGKLTALLAAIEELPQLERDVFSLYHDQEYRMREIGVILDLSESRISQIHKRAIEMLRAAAAAATR